MPEIVSELKCPFCGHHPLDMKPGETVCQVCSTKFKIDDRSECIFVDVNNPKLPIYGTVCNVCGLVQAEASKTCAHCGEKLYPARQRKSHHMLRRGTKRFNEDKAYPILLVAPCGRYLYSPKCRI